MFKNKSLLLFSLFVVILGQTSCTHTDDTQSSASLLSIAERMRLQGNEKTSSSFYQQVLDQDPKNVEAHIGLGKMLRKNKEYDNALKQFQIAFMHHPNNQDVKIEIVRTYIAMNQGKSAALEMHPLLQDNPKNPLFHNLFAVSLDLQGQHLDAQESYKQSLKLQPDQPQVQSNLGLSLAFSGKYPEAIALLEKVTHSPESTPKDRHNLAIAYALSGDLEKADTIFRVDLDDLSTQENARYFSEINVNNKGQPSAPPQPHGVNNKALVDLKK